MTTLSQISETQAQKATTANENFDAVSPAGLFARKATTTTGLTWGYYGGILNVDGTLTTIADGTTLLAASNTNYIEATRAGVVSDNTTGFTAGSIPLYTAVTSGSAITSYIDHREFLGRVYTANLSVAVTTANVTLTAAQARCEIIKVTGALTGNRDLIVPTVPAVYTVNNAGTGGFDLTIKTSGGTGVVVAQGTQSVVFCDGTNVLAAGGSGGGGTPGGSTTQVQYNNAGSFAGSANLTFNGTTLTAAGLAGPHNGTVGAGTPAAGTFTTLTATGALDISGGSAGQISFPATQNPSAGANVLDDYEEGTWTPSFTFGGGATGMTFSTRVGLYSKIGRQVHCQGYALLTAKGSSTGSAKMTGMPFANNSTASAYSIATVAPNSTTGASGGAFAYFSASATTLDLYYTGTGTFAAYTHAHFSDTTDAVVSINYET